MEATTALFFILAAILAVLYFKQRSTYNQAFERYQGIENVESEIEKVKKELLKTQKAQEDTTNKLAAQNKELTDEYAKKKLVYDQLLKETSALEEEHEFISYGLYKPHFDFNTSESYEQKMLAVQDLEKTMLKNKTATLCSKEWTVEGSKQKGAQMVERNMKLMLRAFNGESDAAILKVKWNNVQKMEERIKKAYDAINKMGEPTQIRIVEKYLSLKLDELRLTYEYQEKLYQEREEQRQIREQMREEERAQKELAKAQKDAELEETRWQRALDDARKEMEKATGEELANLNTKMADLEQQLKEAHEKKERAMSQAQLTKRGHIYVISNIGSFGERVFKIGMTRRLEPLDRVRELGDASVPFEFDVHAIIFSENAPELENRLHRRFDDRRLNMVNFRKEFFNVALEEIEAAVKEMHGIFEFTMLAEAKQYRESVAIREAKLNGNMPKPRVEGAFPTAI